MDPPYEGLPQFYSRVTRAIEDSRFYKGTAAEWQRYLDNQVQKGKVTKDELDWTMREYFESVGDRKVSREDILDAMNVGRVGPVGKRWVPGTGGGGGEWVDAARPIRLTETVLSEDAARSTVDGGSARFNDPDFTEPGGTNYREVLIRMEQGPGTPSPGSHWGELGEDAEDIVASLRMNDRVGPNGEKVLFVEEIQSDWHQAGRKWGYASSEGEAQWAAAQGRITEAARVRQRALQTLPAKDHPGYAEAQQAYLRAGEAWGRAIEEAEPLRPSPSLVPDAPLKKTEQWTGLAWRRVLSEAIEGDYDRIAWTTGDMQASRYDLSRHFDEIRWERTAGGKYSIEGRTAPDTDRGVFTEPVKAEGLTVDQLEDHVGKSVARRMAESADDHGVLSGEGLQVSERRGAGLRRMYEKILPTEVQKTGKRLGSPVEVEQVRVGNRGTKPFDYSDIPMNNRQNAVGEYMEELDGPVDRGLWWLAHAEDLTDSDFAAGMRELSHVDRVAVEEALKLKAVELRSVGESLPRYAGDFDAPSVRVTPELKDAVRNKGLYLYGGFPDPTRHLKPSTVIGATAGAAVGATVDEENRGRGALLGAAAGANLPKIVRQLRDPSSWVRGTAGKLDVRPGKAAGFETPAAIVLQETKSVGRYGYVDLPGDVDDVVRRQADDELEDLIAKVVGRGADDRIARVSGVTVENVRRAQGEWGGTRTTNHILTYAEDVTEEALKRDLALRGLVYGQDGQAWARYAGDMTPETPWYQAGWVLQRQGGTWSAADRAALEPILTKYGATIDETEILIRNFDGVDPATIEREIQTAVGSRSHITVDGGQFDGGLYEGTQDYLRILGEQGVDLQEARRLVGELEEAYVGYARRVGADESVTRSRFRERLDGLDALVTEARNPVPRGLSSGNRVSVVEASTTMAERFGPLPPNKAMSTAVDRVESLIDEGIDVLGIDEQRLVAWYQEAGDSQRKILTLMIPELRNQADYVLSQVAAGIVSQGQGVNPETRAMALLMENYLKTGRFSIMTPESSVYFTAPTVVKGEDVVRKAASGRRIEAFGEQLRSGPKAQQWEENLAKLDMLIEEFGNEGAVEHLLGPAVEIGGKAPHRELRLTDLFGEKVGQYAADKLGVPSPTGKATQDLWMSRLYYAIRGEAPPVRRVRNPQTGKVREELDDSVTPAMKTFLDNVMRDLAERRGVRPSDAQALAWYGTKAAYRNAGAIEKVDAYATLASAARDMAERRGSKYGELLEFGPEEITGPVTEGWKPGSKLQTHLRRTGIQPKPKRGPWANRVESRWPT